MSEYSASKGSLSAFHNTLRMELKMKKRKIDTSLICPTFINTGIVQNEKLEKTAMLSV